MSTPDPKKFISNVTAEVRARHYDPNRVEASENSPFVVDPDILRTMFIPDHKFFIFNIGPMDFVVPKGSAGPPGGYIVKACPKGKSFSEPLIMPALVPDTFLDPLTGLIKAHWMRGEDMCNDIVHPLNGRMWSVGQNLDDFGVFWSRTNPPAVKELEEARAKMEVTFRSALVEANMLEATARVDLITPLMRHAASYFEEDRDWNRQYRKAFDCPSCGQSIKAGIAVHSCGAVLDWPKAIFYGARTFQHAKDSEVYSQQLVDAVNVLRENKKRSDELAAKAEQERVTQTADEGGGSFLSSAEITEHEAPNAAERGAAPRKSNLPDLDEQPRGAKKPPRPKRPAHFHES